MKNPFDRPSPAEEFALRHWGEHEEPVARMVARGWVRVLDLKSEPEPVRMLTTEGFEARDRLRAERGLTP